MIQYGIYALLILISIISVVIINILSKKKDFIYKFLFFFFSYYFVMSLIKFKIDGPELTLFQSFWEAVPKTYINYGGPLLGIAVIAPIVAWLIFKHRIVQLAEWQVSLMFIASAIGGLFFGKISNGCYISIYAFCIALSFLMSVALKKELTFSVFDEVKNDLFKKYIIIDSFPVFLIFFYFPNELYLTNISEFNNPYWSFIIILVISTVVLSFVLFGIVCLLPAKWIGICQCTIFTLSFCAYVQYLFLNGSMNSLSGSEQSWNIWQIIINILIWLAFLTISLVLFCKSKKYVVVMRYISLFVMTILFVTAVTLLIQNLSTIGKSSDALTIEGDLTLAGDKNVVVFVLDMYDTRLFEQITQNEPDFCNPLNDFTFYDNTVSKYIMTYFAVPYMLTGADWQDDTNGRWYNRYAYDSDTFLADLYSEGIDIGVYTDVNYVGNNHYSMIRNYRENVEKKSDVFATLTTMSKTSLYKITPFAIKNSYSYYSSDIFYMVDAGEVWNQDNDRLFYERIMNNGISIDSSETAAFRFYHMRGAHDPYYLSEDAQVDVTKTKATPTSQGKGTLKVVYEYIEALKRQGLYDTTTIIITADHGAASRLDDSTGQMTEVSMPLMLVKLPGQKKDSMEYSHAPVDQGDILATILDVYGIDYSGYGYRLEDIKDNQERIRTFGYARPGQGLLMGHVIGEAHDLDNWIVDSVTDIEVEY